MKIHWNSDLQLYWAELDGAPRGTKAERDAYWGQKDAVKAAGFRCDVGGDVTGTEYRWYTRYPEPVQPLARYCVGEAKTRVDALNQNIEDSRAVDADVNLPAPEGLSYLPFQKAGIQYLLNHDRCLLGDEMGLGKTIQTLGLVNADESIKNVLVICPASVRINWVREALKWTVREYNFHRVTDNEAVPARANFVIVGWSNLHQKNVFESLISRDWDLLLVDEAHYAKNQRGAKRAKAVLGDIEYNKRERREELKASGLVHKSQRVVFLTGTPIVNRPIELFPMLRVIDPEGLGKRFMGYAKRYANAHDNGYGYGWDFSGANKKNLAELQRRLRSSCMIRRLKADVLTELPEKTRTVIELDPNGSARLIAKEQKLAENNAAYRKAKEEGDYEAAVRALMADSAAFEEMSQIRHEIGLSKVKKVVEFAENTLANTDKVIIFAHHRDVQNAIAEALKDYGVVQIQGGYSDLRKQESVDAFQGDKNIRVFVGSLEACREGLTLTAASHVIFAELSWTPGAVSQAEDRAHRIGQKNAVSVYHLVINDSLDAYIAHTIVEKQENISASLDTGADKEVSAPELKEESQEEGLVEEITVPEMDLDTSDTVVMATEAELLAPPF